MNLINIYKENVRYLIKNPQKIKKIIKRIINDYEYSLVYLNMIITQDENVRVINNLYLGKDNYTDIISFDYSETKRNIEGELYISFDRIKENAQKYKISIDNELVRIIIHGVLHLVGENDDSASNKLKMRQKEDMYLNLCFT